MATNSNSGEFSLASIMQSASSAFSELQSGVEEIKSLSGQSIIVADALAQALADGTNAQGETALSLKTKELGELETQKNKSDFWAALGMDAEGNAKISNQLATSLQENIRQSTELAKSVREKESVGLLDNPLAYIWNQIVLPDERNALAASLQEGDVLKTSLASVNQALQQTAQSEALYTKTRTAASIDSKIAGIESDFQAKALKARYDALQMNAHNVETIMKAPMQVLDFQAKIVGLRNQEEHMALAREAASRERVRFQEWLDDKKETEEAIVARTNYANATAKQLGLPEFKVKDVELAMKGKGTPGMKERIDEMATVGYINANSGAQGARYGTKFTEAMDFATKVGVHVPVAVSDVTSQAYARVSKLIEEGKVAKNDKKAIAASLDAEVEKLSKGWLKQIDPKDKNNVYAAPDLTVMLQQEAVKASPLGQVLAVQAKAGGLKDTNPDVIMELGLAAVAAGKLSWQDYSEGVRLFYTAASQYNNQQHQLERFGILGQDSYNAKLKVPNVSIGAQGAYRTFLSQEPPNKTYNMMNLADINSVSVKKLAARSMIQFNDNLQQYQSILSSVNSPEAK